MGRKTVITNLCAVSFMLASLQSFACSLSVGQCQAAQEVAAAIKSALPKDPTTQGSGCSKHAPFLITGGDDKSITTSINTAVRERFPSITVKLAPAVPLGAFPVSVADALNRVQLSGGSVKQTKDTGQQSGGLLLAWAGAQLGELVTQAVDALLDALFDQRLTDNYKGYDAVLLYTTSKTKGDIYHEVKFSCKD